MWATRAPGCECEAYTQTVFRAETVYDVGIPFFDLGKITVIDVPTVPGVTKKNMWKGMIGFDRPADRASAWRPRPRCSSGC